MRPAMNHDRSTCSIGWPKPRSVAREQAATNSASRTPESSPPASGRSEPFTRPGRCSVAGPPTLLEDGSSTHQLSVAGEPSERRIEEGLLHTARGRVHVPFALDQSEP